MKQELDAAPSLKVIFGRLIVWLFGVLIGFVLGLDAGHSENHASSASRTEEVTTSCLKGSDAIR